MTSVRSSASSDVRAELKRPKVSFNLLETMAKENDPLPIVELKPFVPKVWRREKSLPGFYDKSDNKSDAGRVNSRNTRETETPVTTTTESMVESPTPASQTTSLPSPRLVHFYVNAFSDFKSQKEHLNNIVGESSFRPKSRIHPPADCVQKKQKQHTDSVIPGFITREDRTKTTLLEITEGESTSKVFSCSAKALAPEDIKKQQEIRVTGAKLTHGNSRKQQLQYLRPFKGVYVNAGWHGFGLRHGSPASSLYQSKSSVTSSQSETRVSRVKTPLYDQLDRKGTLPSLTISAGNLHSRKVTGQDDRHSEDYRDYRDTYERKKREHKVGGIKNSLKVLSKHGTPTKVERQLTFELEINLSRFRKSRDYFPFDITPSEMAKYYPTPIHNLTPGETLIKKGLQSNASRTKRSTHSRGTVSTTLKSAASGDQNFAQGILKKRLETDRSFDRDLDLHITPRTEKGVDSNAEGSVPMETPRSPVNSVKEIKPSWSQEKTEEVSKVKVPQAEEDMETDQRSVTVSSTVSPDDKKDSRKISDTGNPRVPDNGQLLAGHSMGDGRTFITSDNLATIQVSG